MKQYGLIYKVTNIQNNKVYIGQTKTNLKERITWHYNDAFIKNDNIAFHCALRKYGIYNFKWEILGYCNSKEELNNAEIECIYFYRSYGVDGKNKDDIYGYNMTIGGNFLPLLIGDKNPNYKKSPKNRLSQISYESMKKNISISMKGDKNHRFGKNDHTDGIVAFNKSRKGKTLKQTYGNNKADDIKEKMSQSKLGTNNNMYGISIYDYVIKKHGKEKGQDIINTMNFKKSIAMTGKLEREKNPMWITIDNDIIKNIIVLKQLGYKASIINKYFYPDISYYKINKTIKENSLEA